MQKMFPNAANCLLELLPSAKLSLNHFMTSTYLQYQPDIKYASYRIIDACLWDQHMLHCSQCEVQLLRIMLLQLQLLVM